MAYDDKGNYRNEDVLLRMRERNQMVQRRWQERKERILEARQLPEIRIVPCEPVETRLPEMLRNAMARMRQARGSFKLLHFTFQFGRLRIEFSQAKGTAETTRTGGNHP